MTTLRIEGGRRLSGRLTVDGNKNAALPLLAACLLTDEPCTLENVPRISDVNVMVDLLIGLGARIVGRGTSTLLVDCARVEHHAPDPELVGKLRGSVLLMGPLLARTRAVRLAQPGGDFPTRRTIATHLQALVSLGVRMDRSGGHELEVPDGLRGASFYLPEASVTGTETALLAAAGAEGLSEIRNAATEPHVVELCEFLTSMGVPVEGGGSSTIRVQGTSRRLGARHVLQGDYIEAGSWAVVSAVTGGEIVVDGVRALDMEPILNVLGRMKVHYELAETGFSLRPSRPEAIRHLTTGLWPAFPSDMVSLVTVLATQAEGRTLIHDWMYELRLFALEQLSAMRADLFLCDPHRIVVSGPTALRGRTLDSRDLRSGMALIAAALAAEGSSTLSPLETVERGYAEVVERLRSLGAQVEVLGER
jgi:UDP-N-acetylglucosamine 1-carboxyvinyltransferase